MKKSWPSESIRSIYLITCTFLFGAGLFGSQIMALDLRIPLSISSQQAIILTRVGHGVAVISGVILVVGLARMCLQSKRWRRQTIEIYRFKQSTYITVILLILGITALTMGSFMAGSPLIGESPLLVAGGVAIVPIAVIAILVGVCRLRDNQALLTRRQSQKLVLWEKEGYNISEFKNKWFKKVL